jgi:hypothetical protein
MQPDRGVGDREGVGAGGPVARVYAGAGALGPELSVTAPVRGREVTGGDSAPEDLALSDQEWHRLSGLLGMKPRRCGKRKAP